MRFFIPDDQDPDPRDKALSYLIGSARRRGCEFTDDPSEADFWLAQLALQPPRGAQSGLTKEVLIELMQGPPPSGLMPAFIFTPCGQGYLWRSHNIDGPNDVFGPEWHGDEDLTDAFHDFLTALEDSS